MGLVKCYFVQEQIDKAIEACDFALAADDQCGEAYAYKAHCFFYLNNSDDAIENYQKAIELKAIPPELGYRCFMQITWKRQSRLRRLCSSKICNGKLCLKEKVCPGVWKTPGFLKKKEKSNKCSISLSFI